MSMVEGAIKSYWRTSYVTRHPNPLCYAPTVEDALFTLNAVEMSIFESTLDGHNRKLSREVHILKYDLIEGNTKWRHELENERTSFKLIPFTRK